MNNNSDTSSMKREATLTANTKISVQLLVIIMPPLLGIALLYFKLEAMQREIRSNWTVQHQVVWSERLGAQNPTMRVPAVEDVIRVVNKNQ